MDSKRFNLIMMIIGLCLLIFLVSNIDYSYIKDFKFSLTFFNAAVLFFIIFALFILRTFRWVIYLNSVGIKLDFWDAYFIAVPSMGMALFTPAQSGDILKIEFLKKRKEVSRRISFATVFVEKVMDFALIFLIFLIAVSYFSLKTFNIDYYTIGLVFVILCLIGCFAAYVLYKKYEIARIIIKNTKKILSDFNTIYSTLTLTLVYWVIVCLNWVFVARVTNIDISFFKMFGVLAIGTIIGIISFVPGALGVMEYSTIFLLTTFMSVPVSQAAIFALSYRLYAILMYIIAYLHLLFKK